jgi:DNA-binding MarR family transcriptional regulator/GNAT superfamily N-acetyltransferase
MENQENSKENRNIQAVRHFNRFYTRWLGILREKLADNLFSLTEMRIFFELYYRCKTSAVELSQYLQLDAGYVSRILRNFQKKELIESSKNKEDGRQSILTLSSKGKDLFTKLEDQQNKKIEIILKNLTSKKQTDLLKAMKIIEIVLEEQSEKQRPYFLRSHRPGDLGWIVHRHGVFYSEEYGYNEKFEATVADITAKFLHHYDPSYEHCWVVERDGELIGSIVLAKKTNTEGALRLFFVEPQARGLGLGKRLLEECVHFARRVGYKKLSLITHSELHAARHLYEKAGFIKIEQKPYQNWGRDNLIEETWELCLLAQNFRICRLVGMSGFEQI